MTKQTRTRTGRRWTPRDASARLAELKAAEEIAVKVSHYRVPAAPTETKGGEHVLGATAHALATLGYGPPSTHGGLTRTMILDRDGFLLAEGYALCRPDEEFDHRLGLAVALGRALKALDRNPRPLGERVRPARIKCALDGTVDGVLVARKEFSLFTREEVSLSRAFPPTACPACGGPLSSMAPGA